MSLGGGINLAREPRSGRNFEYKGEDPILVGKMVGAEMKALQEQGVTASDVFVDISTRTKTPGNCRPASTRCGPDRLPGTCRSARRYASRGK
jgi:hypothetical protein